MAESAAQSPAVNEPRPRSWTWIEQLLGITGTFGLILFILLVATQLPLSGSDVLFVAILTIPFLLALFAFWQFRSGHQRRRWWLGVIAGLLGLVAALFTAAFLAGGFVPIYAPMSLLIRYFTLYYLLVFLINLTYVVLAFTGIWMLIARFQVQKPRPDHVTVGPSPGVFFDADGHQVVPAYVVQTSPTAVIAFVLVWFVSPIGLILGYVALNEIRRSHGTRTGEGLAKAAIIIGWVWIAIVVALLIALAAR